MKLIKNKRGEVPDFVSDVFSFFLYLLFFLLFFLLFSISFSGCDKFETKNSQIIGDWNYKLGDGALLQNYLRTPIEPDTPSATFSEMIAESCAAGKFDSLISETKDFMGMGVNSLTRNTFEVFCDPASRNGVEIYRTELSTSCPYRLHCTDEIVTSIDIPLPYPASAGSAGPGYARLVTKKCQFLLPTSSGRPLSEREIAKMNIDLSRCVK
jgi:hypothetical protein